MAKPITPELIYHLKTVSDPALSPSGNLLAYTLSWVDEDSLEARSKVMLMDPGSGTSREFTRGEKDSAPKFSPDGRTLAFLRSIDAEHAQVWTMTEAGGEARQLTRLPKGVFDYTCSPDGKSQALCADVDPEGSDQAEGLDSLPKTTVGSRVRYRYDTVGWRGDSHFHIFVLDLKTLESRQITDGDWDDTGPVWSPDSSQIAFMSGRRADRDFMALSEAYTVSATGGEPNLVSEGLCSVGALVWSPDGHQLAVVGSDAPEGMVLWQGWVYVLEDGEKPRRLTSDVVKPYLGFPSVMRPVSIYWTAKEQIIFLGEVSGESYLYQISAQGGDIDVIWGGDCLATGLTLDEAADQAVVVVSSSDSPSDLIQVDIFIGGSIQLSDHNQDSIADHPTATLEKFRIIRPEI